MPPVWRAQAQDVPEGASRSDESAAALSSKTLSRSFLSAVYAACRLSIRFSRLTSLRRSSIPWSESLYCVSARAPSSGGSRSRATADAGGLGGSRAIAAAQERGPPI